VVVQALPFVEKTPARISYGVFCASGDDPSGSFVPVA
jgi:hypothetical protein